MMFKGFTAMAFFILTLGIFASGVDAASGYVNVRNIFQSMGASVEWNAETRTIKITRGKEDIQLTVGSALAYKNGSKILMDKQVRINSRTSQAEMSTLYVYSLAKKTDKEKHYRVKSNDSLWNVARRFGVSVNQLTDWNRLGTGPIYPGQHLHVTDPYYIVQAGDTLLGIALRSESTVEDILKANDLSTDFIIPGQRLWIPPQLSIKPPDHFRHAVFPLLEETYRPYGNNYGDPRAFSTNGAARSHEGIDIMAQRWVPVFSADNGVIIRKGWNTYGGWRLTVRSNNGIAFYYAHMAGYAAGVEKGKPVKKGQLIGYVGSTGYGEEGTREMFDPHLHFGMYDTNAYPWKALNPYWHLKWWEFQ